MSDVYIYDVEADLHHAQKICGDGTTREDPRREGSRVTLESRRLRSPVSHHSRHVPPRLRQSLGSSHSRVGPVCPQPQGFPPTKSFYGRRDPFPFSGPPSTSGTTPGRVPSGPNVVAITVSTLTSLMIRIPRYDSRHGAVTELRVRWDAGLEEKRYGPSRSRVPTDTRPRLRHGHPFVQGPYRFDLQSRF